MIYLLARRRIGFLVDAAILGFAVGTGFALVENAEYLRALGQGSVFLWIVRGFGTAVLHGGATAILAVVAKGLEDRHPGAGVAVVLPGFVAAVGIHSLYNHFILPPVLATLVLFVTLPVLLVLVFAEERERDPGVARCRLRLGGGPAAGRRSRERRRRVAAWAATSSPSGRASRVPSSPT